MLGRSVGVYRRAWSPVWAARQCARRRRNVFALIFGAPEINVTGNGIDIPDGSATPSGADFTDFGTVAEGGFGPSRTFVVENTGGADLNISSISVPIGFAVIEGLPLAIAPASSDEFTLEMTSSLAGVYAGNVTIVSDDADETTYTFAITGEVTSATPSGGARSTSRSDFIRGTVFGLIRN